MSNTINVQGSYIDVHDNQNVYLSVDKAEVRMGNNDGSMVEEEKAGAPVPDVLASEEAKELMESLADAGILTEEGQPVGLSGAEKGELAMQLAMRLDISNVWQVFGSLWGMKPETLRAAFNRGRDQKKNAKFQDRLKNIIG